MYAIQDVAHWFLSRSDTITNKKLQKLVYYAYAWHLTIANEPGDLSNRLFPNDFQAWVHGAVSPSLYREYKAYGSAVIPRYKDKLADFSLDELDILTQVESVYGEYNGNQLESICHQESPWIKARAGIPPYVSSDNPIKDEDIYECYASRLSYGYGELNAIKRIVNAYKRNWASGDKLEIINGVKFFIDPKVELTDALHDDLENFALSQICSEEAYTVFNDEETGEAVIY